MAGSLLSCRADEVTLDAVKAEFNTGKSFVYDKCDKYGRPVLIITASKHNIGAHSRDAAGARLLPSTKILAMHCV
jgi:hypothetical protein